jgi:CBS domain-containing membrane protein
VLIVFKRFSSASSTSHEHRSSFRRHLGNFIATPAGSTVKNQLRASLGALIGIGFTGLISAAAFGTDARLPLIVAPMGASAVLLFAVPASPLAQPWSIIGGNTVSVLVGIAVGQFVHEPMAATGIAVGLAVVAMSLARCLHPPGGAAALTAIIGGPSVAAAGFAFALVPVFLNAVLLVLLGIVYHRLSGHSYPHIQPVVPNNPHRSACLSARDSTESPDVDRRDIAERFVQLEAQARSHPPNSLSTLDLFSQEVIKIPPNEFVETARMLLLGQELNSLPIVDASGRLLGIVGLRELARDADRVSEVMAPAIVVSPDASLSDLIQASIHGKGGPLVMLDDHGHILGLVSSDDILKGFSRSMRPAPRLENSRRAHHPLSGKEPP